MRKFTAHFLLLVHVIFAPSLFGDEEKPTLSEKEVGEVRRALKDYVSGHLTLEQITEMGGREKGRNLVLFYMTHKSEVTTQMKLPVSRAYAGFRKFDAAAQLAKEYVNVYSNDWRGWNILGAARMAEHVYGEAIAAWTNAFRLGSTNNLVAFGAATIAGKRLDIFEDVVLPRMLGSKDSGISEIERVRMVNMLVLYSLEAKRADVFVKALSGLEGRVISSDDDLSANVRKGCEIFNAKETEELCRRLGAKQRTQSPQEKGSQ